MAKRTTQGAEKRKREDDKMTGHPVDTNPKPSSNPQRQPNTTRDQAVDPAPDDESDRDSSQRDDLGENR